MKESVGVILYVRDHKNFPYVVLTRRGPGVKQDGKPETWQGLYQVSAHGGVEAGDGEGEERWIQALYREIQEELGSQFAGAIPDQACKDSLKLLGESNDNEKAVRTYALEVSLGALAYIRLEWPTIGICLVGPWQVEKVQTIKDGDYKKDEPITGSEMVMFPDELAAVKQVLLSNMQCPPAPSARYP